MVCIGVLVVLFFWIIECSEDSSYNNNELKRALAEGLPVYTKRNGKMYLTYEKNTQVMFVQKDGVHYVTDLNYNVIYNHNHWVQFHHRKKAKENGYKYYTTKHYTDVDKNEYVWCKKRTKDDAIVKFKRINGDMYEVVQNIELIDGTSQVKYTDTGEIKRVSDDYENDIYK